MLRQRRVVRDLAGSHNRTWRSSGERDAGMATGPLVITGANGNLGRRLLVALSGDTQVLALVRSESAAQRLRELDVAAEFEVRVVDYLDRAAMAAAVAGAAAVVHLVGIPAQGVKRKPCRAVAVVHLVGIIKEPRAGAYHEAHEETSEILAETALAAGVERIVYLSILGASPEAPNPCLASKGRAERILLDSGVPTRVLRVPMVLGEGDYASAALAHRARRPVSLVFRGASLEQPIYAGDLIRAIVGTLHENLETVAGALDLAGPESLSRVALTRRAARCLGRSTTVVSLPLGLGLALAWILQRVASPPPVTTAMLGVLDHDDAIDPLPASQALGISLTSLEEMLTSCLTTPQSP